MLLALLALAALMLVGVSSNLWVARGSSARMKSRCEDVPHAPIAIILGAGLRADGSPCNVLEDRLIAGAALYRAQRVERILVSGGLGRGGVHESDAMAAWLRSHGIPGDAISRDLLGVRTRATMYRAARQFSVVEAVVCTQAFHLPRALYLARRAGIEASGLIADRQRYQMIRRALAREWLARVLAILDEYVLRGK